MTEFTSEEKIVNASQEVVYARLSNLENLRTFIDKIPTDKIPADKLQQFQNLKITADSLTIPGGSTGEITFAIDRKEPNSLIRLAGVNMPVALYLELRIEAVTEDTSKVVVCISADIPMMLKPMVKGPLQKATDQFAEVLTAIPFHD